jgi:cell division transport system ATP-binding protein
MDAAAVPLSPMIVFDRVTKRYGDRTVIELLSFVIARSEFVLLSGPSGSGKSTLLRLVAALEQPTAGAITVAGERLANIKPRTLPYLRRSIGIVPQELRLLDDRSALENVALPVAAAGLPRGEALSRATTALRRVGLDDFDARALPTRLSGGVRQRVALARALVNRPALLLVDEPLLHHDDASTAPLMHLLEQFAGAGVTVLLASRSSVGAPPRARTIALEAALTG